MTVPPTFSFTKFSNTLFLIFFFLSPVNYAQANLPRTQLPYTIKNKSYHPLFSAEGYQQQGVASWYGSQFHGRLTSNGELFDMHAMTAAHKTLPMNTLLQVRNLENGRTTIVRINDRGPFIEGRIIDLSYAAARFLKIVQPGTARVELSVVDQKTSNKFKRQLFVPQQHEKEYYVQIGAFSEPHNAQRIQRHFQDAGYKAVIRTSHRQKRNVSSLHLVQVYVGKNYQHAQKAEKTLLKRGYNKAFLIAYHQEEQTTKK